MKIYSLILLIIVMIAINVLTWFIFSYLLGYDFKFQAGVTGLMIGMVIFQYNKTRNSGKVK